MALAESFGIYDYPSPAGGCLVTEKNFQRRFSDLIRHAEDAGMTDLILLKYGRHFRISERCKLVVGKHREENEYLKRIPRDSRMAIDVVYPAGPFSLLDWDGRPSSLKRALEIIARYCIHKAEGNTVRYRLEHRGREKKLSYTGVPDRERIDALIIR